MMLTLGRVDNLHTLCRKTISVWTDVLCKQTSIIPEYSTPVPEYRQLRSVSGQHSTITWIIHYGGISTNRTQV
jgi:hypothetical protein